MHIFSSRLYCSAIFRCDMFEPVEVTLFSHIFMSIMLLSNFLICLNLFELCLCLIEYDQDMFEPVDFFHAAEVRNFLKSSFFFLSQLDMSIDLSICSSD